MRLALLVFCAVAIPGVSFAQSTSLTETKFQGRLGCESIPSVTKAPLDVDMILTIKDDQIEFSRSILSPDGKYVVAKETGTGTLAPDGTVNLQGGAGGKTWQYASHYQDKIQGRELQLRGTQSWEREEAKPFERDCMALLSR